MRIERRFVTKIFVLAYFAFKFVFVTDEFANFFDNWLVFKVQRIKRMFGFNMFVHVTFFVKTCITFQAFEDFALSMTIFVMFSISFQARKRFFAFATLAILNLGVLIRERLTNDHQMTVTAVMLIQAGLDDYVAKVTFQLFFFNLTVFFLFVNVHRALLQDFVTFFAFHWTIHTVKMKSNEV